MWPPGPPPSEPSVVPVEDRGASSTVGLFLMVSVTVVAFGVLAVEVSSLTALTSPAPQVAFQYDFTDDGDADELVVVHHSGTEVPGGQLFVAVSGATPGEADGEYRWNGTGLAGAPTVGSGASVELNATSIGDGSDLNLDSATVEIVWRPENRNRSAVVSRWSGPDADAATPAPTTATPAPTTATPTPANQAPTADFTYDRKGASHNVDLDAAPSTDPDGSIVSYEWDVDDDGNYEETGETVRNANVPRGTDVTLRVTDDAGATDERVRTVTSGGE